MNVSDNIAEAVVSRSISLCYQELRLLKERAQRVLNANKFNASNEAKDLATFILKISYGTFTDEEVIKDLFTITETSTEEDSSPSQQMY